MITKEKSEYEFLIGGSEDSQNLERLTSEQCAKYLKDVLEKGAVDYWVEY